MYKLVPRLAKLAVCFHFEFQIVARTETTLIENGSTCKIVKQNLYEHYSNLHITFKNHELKQYYVIR